MGWDGMDSVIRWMENSNEALRNKFSNLLIAQKALFVG